MKLSTIERIDAEIVKYLSEQGVFPAIKDRREEIVAIEDSLSNKLHRMQMGLESTFIQKLRERGYIPTGANQNALIDEILSPVFDDMSNQIAKKGVESAKVGRQLTIEDIIEQGMSISFTQFGDDILKKLSERIYEFSQETFNRIKGDFAKTLTQGYEDGKGINEIARDLRADFKNLRDWKLKRIARTEINTAQNEGIDSTMEDYGVTYKQWLTALDNRVRGVDPSDRFDHISLHGEVVERTKAFSNGLMFPLDRSGKIGEWINCRCRMRPYIPKRNEQIITTPYYPNAA